MVCQYLVIRFATMKPYFIDAKFVGVFHIVTIGDSTVEANTVQTCFSISNFGWHTDDAVHMFCNGFCLKLGETCAQHDASEIVTEEAESIR